MTSGKREREREKRKPRSERERERRESDDRADAIDDRQARVVRSSIYRRDRRSRDAIDKRARRMRTAHWRDRRWTARSKNWLISFAGFWFLI